MWLNPDFAKVLLVVGLLLSLVALGGEQATRYFVAAEPMIERSSDVGGPTINLPLEADCVR